MAKEEFKLVVSSEVRDALKGFGDVDKALKDVGKSEDDTKSKGEQMADALKVAADQMEAEFAGARAATDALGAALGDELVADIKAAGGSVDGLVANFRQAGLTYDDVRADADQLADAIKRLGDVGKAAGAEVEQGARQAEGGLERVHGEADQSRSVMANLVGNSAQDLGALGGVAGTTGMALGQLGEYAAEGNIRLGELVKVAGPMALVTAAVYGVGEAMKNVAAAKAFQKDQIEAYRKALQGATNDVAAVRDKLVEAGKVDFRVLNNNIDITPALNAVNLSVGQFSSLVAGGTPRIEAWSKMMLDAGANADAVAIAANAASQQANALAGAHDAAAASAKFFGESTDNATTAVDKSNQALSDAVRSHDDAQAAEERHKTAVDETRQAIEDARDAVDNQRQALEDLRTEELRGINSKYDYLNSATATAKALKDYNEKLASGKLSTEEVRDATEDMRQKMVDTATAFADQSGAAQGSKEYIDAMIESLYNQALAMDPNSPARQAILGYIAQLQGIEPTVATKIYTDVDEASLAVAKGELDIAAAPREVRIHYSVTGDDRLSGARAAGGPVDAGGAYLVGEQGPEIVVPRSAGTVIPHHQTRALLGSAAGGITNVFNGLMIGGPELRHMFEVASRSGSRYQRYGSRLVA